MACWLWPSVALLCATQRDVASAECIPWVTTCWRNTCEQQTVGLPQAASEGNLQKTGPTYFSWIGRRLKRVLPGCVFLYLGTNTGAVGRCSIGTHLSLMLAAETCLYLSSDACFFSSLLLVEGCDARQRVKKRYSRKCFLLTEEWT